MTAATIWSLESGHDKFATLADNWVDIILAVMDFFEALGRRGKVDHLVRGAEKYQAEWEKQAWKPSMTGVRAARSSLVIGRVTRSSRCSLEIISTTGAASSGASVAHCSLHTERPTDLGGAHLYPLNAPHIIDTGD